MLSRLARFVTSHSRQVLLLALLIVLAAAAYGSSAVSHLSSGGFTDSSSPSTKADALLSERFHQGDPNLVFLLQSPSGVNSPAARSVGTRPGRPTWLAKPTSRESLRTGRSRRPPGPGSSARTGFPAW